MTERLYYHDSFLNEFDATVLESIDLDGRPAVVLDRTAFYPSSGGQVHDTGALHFSGAQATVTDVIDSEDGRILHITSVAVPAGATVHGAVDSARRLDHIQQHSGQHVLSAAFIRLFNFPTLSFHMGAETCTIDLGTSSVSPGQMEQAERLANEVIAQDVPVSIRFAGLEEARTLGLRKLPPKQTGTLRVIDISGFDRTACGGTHVRATGQIGAILLRKLEKVRQGVRVEFVCGLRAVAAARQDFVTLSETATLYSAHLKDVPQQVRKSLEDLRSADRTEKKLLEDLAQLHAERLLASHTHGQGAIVAVFPEREALFIRLVAQKLTAGKSAVVALLGSCAGQPALVFAQSPGLSSNMGQLLRETAAQLGGRGGGSADLAQGGFPAGDADPERLEKILREAAARL